MMDNVLMISKDFGQVSISDTQKIRVLELEDGNISIQKWWRKDVTSVWTLGKGFILDRDKTIELGTILTDLK